MTTSRQVARQIELFLEDGQRERLTVALAILDGMAATPENGQIHLRDGGDQ